MKTKQILVGVMSYAMMCINSNSEPECSGTDIRLVNGNTQYSGTVQICHDGFWSIICGYGWDDINARVACRQLGVSPLGMTILIKELCEICCIVA